MYYVIPSAGCQEVSRQFFPNTPAQRAEGLLSLARSVVFESNLQRERIFSALGLHLRVLIPTSLVLSRNTVKATLLPTLLHEERACVFSQWLSLALAGYRDL